MSLSMGIYEEIEDAKITAGKKKNQDLKIKAKIWKLPEISFLSCDLILVVSLIFNLAVCRIQLRY